ncbi:hypothetical protein [Novosphingobium sp.]|uniref:hypothetical protein n=1 Tax=Novosphingobium sp. TaxID=1874826 RepID=UPI002626D393|nr:hypothetical protein [Novosphingobium sp.]
MSRIPSSTSTDTARKAGFHARIVGLWIACSAVLLAIAGPMAWYHLFPDADDSLRMVQVRDLVNGQGWFDFHQYRINPPDGVLMHWSRLVDLPLAATIMLLRPLLGEAAADMLAALLVPLVLLLGCLLLVGRLGRRMVDPGTGLFAVILCFLIPPAMLQLAPLRVDHHGWQILLSLLALSAMFAPKSWSGGAIAGTALAASLSISLETLPLAAVFGATCALRLVRGEQGWLGGYAAGLGASSIALFLATRGLGDLASHCDSISPGYLAALTSCATGGLLAEGALRHGGKAGRPLAIGVLGLAGGGAVLALWLVAPACLRGGAFAELDPIVRTMWYERVLEGLPFWRHTLGNAALLVLFPLVGLSLALRAAYADWRAGGVWQRWFDYALLLGGATVTGMLVARASATAGLFAAVPVAWQVHRLFLQYRAEQDARRRVPMLLVMAAFAFPALPFLIVSPLVSAKTSTAVKVCRYWDFLPAFDAMAPGVVFAPLDLGPPLLEGTHHAVVATGHHRGNAAMRDVISAFTGTDDSARRLLAQHRADWLMICPRGNEETIYRRHAPDGFMAHLAKGQAPGWLEPVSIAPQSGVKVWRIKRAEP